MELVVIVPRFAVEAVGHRPLVKREDEGSKASIA
jgi:hypothetical protein